MQETRQNKIARLLQKELSLIFQQQTRGIETFNDYLAQDDRVEQVILPLRDGLTLIRKR